MKRDIYKLGSFEIEEWRPRGIFIHLRITYCEQPGSIPKDIFLMGDDPLASKIIAWKQDFATAIQACRDAIAAHQK